MDTRKEEEELYNNSIIEKVYFTNGDMALHFQTNKDKQDFDKLIDEYIKFT